MSVQDYAAKMSSTERSLMSSRFNAKSNYYLQFIIIILLYSTSRFLYVSFLLYLPSGPRSVQKNPTAEEKEEESVELQKKRDAQLEEEANRLKEEVEKLRVEMEKLEESQKHWEERKEEDVREEEVDEEKKKEREEEKRREEVEEIKREHKREMQSLVSEYSSAQTHLQARIVALENEWVEQR